jgi:FkbM family methyltransferase
VIKSKFLTSIFQNYLVKRDIKTLKDNYFYYVIFRLLRNFFTNDLIISIYNFKVFGSIKKNKTSYFLLKKCEFGDYHELNTIKKFSKKNKLIFLDCGCNYGFYSFYTASLNKDNIVISIEASKKTSDDFIKNLSLNNFSNINFLNNAISNIDNEHILFNESVNDWESSQTHKNFKLSSTTTVKTVKIDTILKSYNYLNLKTIIKLDIEGNEMSAIDGALEFIKKTSPLIIIEFSKYIFDQKNNIGYLKNFLKKYDYSIYDTNANKINIDEVLNKINELKVGYNTIGNYYLIKNLSKELEDFLSNE